MFLLYKNNLKNNQFTVALKLKFTVAVVNYNFNFIHIVSVEIMCLYVNT